MWVQVIGWLSSTVLLLTLVQQVRKQWRERQTRGVSRWLFIGQLLASAGFVAYSLALDNRVFVVTNTLLFINALVGLFTFHRNRRGHLDKPAANDDRNELTARIMSRVIVREERRLYF